MEIMDSITINLTEMNKLVQDGTDIYFSQEAEEALVKLLEIQKQVEEAVKSAKEILEAKGLEMNPNFKSISGDKVRVGYRYFGSQYAVDESRVNEIPTELYKTKTSYSVETKALENYLKQHEGLPLGIVEKDRKKTITISIIGESDGDNE